MGHRTARRRSLDEQLLANGPMPREQVIHRLSMKVQPGHAARTAASRRTSPEGEDEAASQRIYEVGARRVAVKDVQNARTRGVWIEEDGMIRHRDWRDTVLPMFRIPTRDELHGIARLMLASGWERAAIVAAHVMLGAGHGGAHQTDETVHLLSARKFAELGIVGLTRHEAVVRYAKAWQATGLPRPEPGQDVALPTQPFPKVGEHPEPVSAIADTPPKPRQRPSRRTEAEALLASNDAREVAKWFTANKTPEFLRQFRAELAPRQRTRTRSGNVIPIRGAS